MAGTTPVTIFEDTFTQTRDWFHLPTLTDELTLHQLGAVCGNETFSYSYSKTQFPSTSISRWGPIKIPQPWLSKSKLLWPSLKSLPEKIRK